MVPPPRKRTSDVKKLTLAQCKERDAIIAEVGEAARALEAAAEHYNDVLGKARDFRDTVTAKMEDYIDARSETWLASYSAEEYRSWVETWNEADFDDIELPELPHKETLEDLADNLEYA